VVRWTQEQRDWARERLERFVAACRRYDQDQKARRYDGLDEGLYNEMIKQEPTTKRIIAELDPKSRRHQRPGVPGGLLHGSEQRACGPRHLG
jgi:hypothetical protein